jgi:hypothetical protein
MRQNLILIASSLILLCTQALSLGSIHEDGRLSFTPSLCGNFDGHMQTTFLRRLKGGCDVTTKYQIEASLSRDDELLVRRAKKFWRGLDEDISVSNSIKCAYRAQFKSILDVLTNRMECIRKGNASWCLSQNFRFIPVQHVL